VALEQLPLHSEGRQAAAVIEMALVVSRSRRPRLHSFDRL
jgi:hypothetical protein